MAGAILENLSAKKLLVFCVVLLIVQILCFLVGGLVAPSPSTSYVHTATKCIDPAFNLKKWFVPWGTSACEKVRDFDEAIRKEIYADWIVFSIHIPNRPFEMSRWFQYLLGVLSLDIVYKDAPMMPDAELTMLIRLGYRDSLDEDFTELISANETRKLDCGQDLDVTELEPGYSYDCSPMQLFELGSIHHKYYLINIRLPIIESDKNSAINTGIGSLQDIQIVSIHQNGGFTKVWISLKTFMFPFLLLCTLWFWHRVLAQPKSPVLMERTILALAIIMDILNFPMEWLTLWVEVPFMTLLIDIKQGAFYAMLFSFWIIFVGEHLMDQTQRNRLKVYWRQVCSVVFTFFCLFVFDMCERGVQLANPFFSMWNTEKGQNLAMAFIILAGVCLCAYSIFLMFMVYQVMKNINMRRTTLPHMAKARRLHYEGLIYRFRFFMLYTVVTAICTVVFFILSQTLEGQAKSGQDRSRVQYTSAFFTGVYGMWNIYVLAVMILYAPSHKKGAGMSTHNDGSEGSNVQFEIDVPTAPSAAGALTEAYQLLSKTATE